MTATAQAMIVEFDMPGDMLNLNVHRSTRDKMTGVAAWRDVAYYHYAEAFPGVGPSGRAFPSPAEVFTVLPVYGRRRRDPINFAPTVKAIVDGFVLAGAWPDDTPDIVRQHLPTFRPTLTEGDRRVMIRIRECAT